MPSPKPTRFWGRGNEKAPKTQKFNTVPDSFWPYCDIKYDFLLDVAMKSARSIAEELNDFWIKALANRDERINDIQSALIAYGDAKLEEAALRVEGLWGHLTGAEAFRMNQLSAKVIRALKEGK